MAPKEDDGDNRLVDDDKRMKALVAEDGPNR